MKPLVAVDFETEAIKRRPDYPPKPVGVALYGDGIKAEYLAWGHPSGNNCSAGQAVTRLRDIYRTSQVVFHSSEFDVEVGHEAFGLALPQDYHDTLFLGFLHDPRSETLSLKPMADELLDMPPTEQQALKRWVVKHVVEATESGWGAYISKAPGDMVAPYAKGDVIRTYRLFKKLHPYIVDAGMSEAYQRELRFMPVKLQMERAGIRTDTRRLKRDIKRWVAQRAELEAYLIKRLGGARKLLQFARNPKRGFNINSGDQLADALEAAGLVKRWQYTKGGKDGLNKKRSTKREHLTETIGDAKIVEALTKRVILDKYCNTYGEKWIEVGEQNDGYVFPTINQVRSRKNDEDRTMGARTGRLSYSDSWQAIPKPDRRPYPDLPNLRDYIIPDDEGDVILVRDYSQQEFRILAHYEDGPLLARYQADPTIDMHQSALEMINELTGLGLDPKRDRRPVKDIGFGLIYGMGLAKTARKTHQPLEMTKLLRASYLQAIPGLKDLSKSIKRRCRDGEPIRTWGGRLYWVEDPKMVDGELKSLEYKMLNVLIQGSAADCTKEAAIRAHHALRDSRILMLVHDEFVNVARRSKMKREMALLREAMEGVEFDVKMLSDGSWSPKSWGSPKPFKE